MDHNQKSEEVLQEVLFESWMPIAEWKAFLKAAKKQVGYCAEYLASDIASQFKTNEFIDSRMNEMKSFKVKYFAL